MAVFSSGYIPQVALLILTEAFFKTEHNQMTSIKTVFNSIIVHNVNCYGVIILLYALVAVIKALLSSNVHAINSFVQAEYNKLNGIN